MTYMYSMQLHVPIVGIVLFQKISIPSHREVLVSTSHPSVNSSFVLYFILKFVAFETPSPLEFPMTLLGVGMVIFWNCTLYVCGSIDFCLSFKGIQAKPLNEDDMFTWEGTIKGPKDTMWEGNA